MTDDGRAAGWFASGARLGHGFWRLRRPPSVSLLLAGLILEPVAHAFTRRLLSICSSIGLAARFRKAPEKSPVRERAVAHLSPRRRVEPCPGNDTARRSPLWETGLGPCCRVSRLSASPFSNKPANGVKRAAIRCDGTPGQEAGGNLETQPRCAYAPCRNAPARRVSVRAGWPGPS